MRYSDVVQRRFSENPDLAERFYSSAHQIFKIGNEIGCSSGEMVSFLLDRYGIRSVFIPFREEEPKKVLHVLEALQSNL